LTEDGTLRSARVQGYSLATLPLLGQPRDAVLAVRSDGELHFERFAGPFTSGWVDSDELVMFEAGKVTLLAR
jgi:hypothetical protein